MNKPWHEKMQEHSRRELLREMLGIADRWCEQVVEDHDRGDEHRFNVISDAVSEVTRKRLGAPE